MAGKTVVFAALRRLWRQAKEFEIDLERERSQLGADDVDYLSRELERLARMLSRTANALQSGGEAASWISSHTPPQGPPPPPSAPISGRPAPSGAARSTRRSTTETRAARAADSLPPDLHWAAEDISGSGPVFSPFSGLSSLGPARRRTAGAPSLERRVPGAQLPSDSPFDELRLRPRPDVSDGVAIDVYLDTDDRTLASEVLIAVDELAAALGYSHPRFDFVRYGSIFTRAWTAIRDGFTFDEVLRRTNKAERALELRVVDRAQAEVDEITSRAMMQLIESVSDVSAACIRVGSLIVIKYETAGDPVIMARQLSQREVTALDRHPEIQHRPAMFNVNLAHALDVMELPEAGDDSRDFGG